MPVASLTAPRAVVIGAGVGGLAAAIRLAARGVAVTVVERAAAPGGKLRALGAAAIDSGPTVLTLRDVFEDLFAAAGRDFASYVKLEPAEVLARHAWSATERLDLFASRERSVDAIGAFAGAADARGYERFATDAARLCAALDRTFMRAPRPRHALALAAALGLRGNRALLRASPFRSLAGALTRYFRDARLRQLFGRYATYCGSSPFAAPATLMVIAHVEARGVWLVEGGMARLAAALAQLARELGVEIRYGAAAANVVAEHGCAAGVVLDNGERLAADAIVANVDANALAAGLLGSDAREAVGAGPPAARSLSALTWSMETRTAGFPLSRHNVFFSRDYAREFDELFGAGRLPSEPTVYVCAQDRGARAHDESTHTGSERLFVLVNAPAESERPLLPQEIERCRTTTWELLARCGLRLGPASASITTTPTDFARLFPGTGGALYGMASHGWQASFRRPTAETRLPGLFLAGGSVHPGAGLPMAALSGQLAAASATAFLASTSTYRRAATRGGTSMRSATMDATRSR